MAVTTFKKDKELGQDLNTIATSNFSYDINYRASRWTKNIPKSSYQELSDEATNQVDCEMLVVVVESLPSCLTSGGVFCQEDHGFDVSWTSPPTTMSQVPD